MITYGLIGKTLSHSFSSRYFARKFELLSLTNKAEYRNFELSSIEHFSSIFDQKMNFGGFNVTIPYKESILPFLTRLDFHAQNIGAVNTIALRDSQLVGFNTDWLGFSQSLGNQHFKKAAILGTGGASKAIVYALQQLETETQLVSRNTDRKSKSRSYRWLNEHITEFDLIVNCTPVGTAPNTNEMPPIATEKLSSSQMVYDLIYNPEKTALLQKAEEKGCAIKNGYEMLVLQAEESWRIWNQ